MMPTTADNTAYTLRLRLALRDIAPPSRNVVYAGNVVGHAEEIFKKQDTCFNKKICPF